MQHYDVKWAVKCHGTRLFPIILTLTLIPEKKSLQYLTIEAEWERLWFVSHRQILINSHHSGGQVNQHMIHVMSPPPLQTGELLRAQHLQIFPIWNAIYQTHAGKKMRALNYIRESLTSINVLSVAILSAASDTSTLILFTHAQQVFYCENVSFLLSSICSVFQRFNIVLNDKAIFKLYPIGRSFLCVCVSLFAIDVPHLFASVQT